MSQSILFVCLGNICRSPAAEAVTRAFAQGRGVRVDSAGTSGWHIGEPPYGAMQAAARARGYDMSTLRARQFSTRDFGRFDMIVVMDDENRAEVEALRPAGDGTTVVLFTNFADVAGPFAGADHVPDPYYTRDFDGTLDLIEDCARGLIARL
ncbi:low molecular weight protein-tyrosine-phosphatase [Maritimibacter sp. DP1N21-5]|uniref:low molecular weight protein-tyrosine-phosphatase n=1 Tax=Maritimibacter sp. DP1N21-5 TaxID=2836867 RepID=UPI001C477D3E|nr:low molecular weight protein-tyrosine-phosphatase [Maritimibacter sp. DP1N21-5]MBV7408018.1 low molecular weight phosphotyrosine protein phosphatase [Maritimibacter sp. DP1N21-5]